MKSAYDLSTISMSQAALGIASKKLDCLDILEEHIKAINSHNKKLNALIYINEKRAKDQMKILSAEAKKGALRGRLHGITFSAKDTVAVAGLPQSDGSITSLKHSAPQDSTLIAKLLKEGAVCIGKANMAERGKSYYTDNPIYGRTNNPFDQTRSPGGSGGGDAAAVACNFAQFGIGADAGGSIRVPAAFCGLFGLFPTRGVFSDTSPTRFSHTVPNLFRNNGVISKSLDDLELLFKVLKGYDPLDPVSVEPAIGHLNQAMHIKSNFIYFDNINGVRSDNQISQQLEGVKERFQALGFTGQQGAPDACKATYEIYIILAGQAMLILEDHLATQGGAQLDLSHDGPTITNLRKRITSELPPLNVEMLLKCWYTVDLLRNEIAKIFSNFDFILTPIAATLPPLHDTSRYEIDGQSLQSQQVFQFSSLVNVLGLPAITFPVGVSKNGLPIGLQIIGARFSEKRLFDIIRMAGYTERVCYPKL